jgi:hypothetical protein
VYYKYRVELVLYRCLNVDLGDIVEVKNLVVVVGALIVTAALVVVVVVVVVVVH